MNNAGPSCHRCRSKSWLPWLIPVTMVCVWTCYVLSSYEIRAYSDPLNWLYFARNLSAEIHTSRFAVGFPLFLRPALILLGPYWVFLVNMPVLAATFLLAARLAVKALDRHLPAEKWQTVVFALVFFFSFDPWLVLQMVNPFRDPLSFLFSLGAANLLVDHADTAGSRLSRAALCGLLLGIASSIRETSILMLPPFAIYAFWSWRKDSRIHFFRDGMIFMLGFGIGLLPLLAQSFLSTGQVLLPAQSAIDNKLVPGAHFNWPTLSRTLRRAWQYYMDMAPLGMPLFIACGLLAICQRNRIVLGLLLPAAVIHAGFYAFYWTFVPRYFYSVAIFSIPAFSWFLHVALLHIPNRPFPRLKKSAPVVFAILAALFTIMKLGITRPASSPFQIPQARLLKADLESQVPPDSLVFSRRNLCEIIRWFTHVRSFPATSLIPVDVPAEDALRTALESFLQEDRPKFLLEMNSGTEWETDAALLQRIWEMKLVESFPADRYHLRERTGAESLRLFKYQSSVPPRLPLPDLSQARNSFARFDFSLKAVPDALPLLSGSYDPPTLACNVPCIHHKATIALPGPVGSNETATAEVRIRSPIRGKGRTTFSLSLGNRTHTFSLPNNRSWHYFTISASGPLDSPELEFDDFDSLELHRVDWSIPAPSSYLHLDIGTDGDFSCLKDGWYDRESTTGGNARWSQPRAALFWRCAAPLSPGRITLRHFSRNRPPDALPPRVLINQTQLSLYSLPNAEDGCTTLTAEIPPDLLQPMNRVHIETEGWTPGGNDPRTLGIFLDWIRFESTTTP
jgi:hypothetical protein